MLFTLGLGLFFLIILWLVGYYIANDFSLPTRSPKGIMHALIIFPHPDDEVSNAGGLIAKLSNSGVKTTLVFLTKGERGTPNASLNESLKNTRTKETKKSANILGVTALIHEDFGDGELSNKKKILTSYIDQLLKQIKPDLVVTYDLAGLYGHPDHIAASEVITLLIKTKHKHIQLWYPSFPKRVLSIMTLPEHMATDPALKNKRAAPEFKVLTLLEIPQRLRSLYAHQSQLTSIKNSFPIKFLPLWFYCTLQTYEYYVQVTPD